MKMNLLFLPLSLVLCISLQAATFYVNSQTGNNAWDGTAATEQGGNVGPKASIQAAVDAAGDGDTVSVAPGTYSGAGNRDIDISNKSITLQSESGAANCIIDAGGSDAANHRAFLLVADCTLDGFTIRNGYANSGGAIYISQNDPIIKNCIFSSNQSVGSGGALAAVNGDFTLTSCRFLNNRAGSGGAVYISDGDVLIDDCDIINNDVLGSETGMFYLGGGLCCESDSSITLSNSQISGNYAGSFGGGIFVDDSDLIMVNCLVTGNWANVYGGGLYYQHGTANIINCTLAHNRAVTWGGGIRFYLGCAASISNSIIWGNVAYGQAASSQMALAENAMINIAGSNIEGGQQIYREAGSILNWSATNFSATPGFVRNGRQDPSSGGDDSSDNWSWIEGDYRLLSDSPCIDQGDNQVVSGYPDDISGNRRVSNGVVDLGPYENGLLIDRFIVKAARVGQDRVRPANQDMFIIMGRLDAMQDDFDHDQMAVRLGLFEGEYEDTIDMTSSDFFAHPRRPFYIYKRRILPGDLGGVTMMKFDVTSGFFTILGQFVDLSGMTGTVPFQLDIGDGAYAVTGVAGEDIVNAAAPVPMELMFGVTDSIRVDRLTYRHITTRPESDFLMVFGAISVADAETVLTGKEVTFKFGTYEAVIPSGSKGLSSKGGSVYIYKKPRELMNAQTQYADMAFFDLTRCMFKLMVRNADIGAQTGTVEFGISFGDFDQTTDVVVE